MGLKILPKPKLEMAPTSRGFFFVHGGLNPLVRLRAENLPFENVIPATYDNIAFETELANY